MIYPVDGQKGVPVAFPGHEVPDPIPEAHGGVAGFPITATFPRSVAVRKARATLLDPDGREVRGVGVVAGGRRPTRTGPTPSKTRSAL